MGVCQGVEIYDPQKRTCLQTDRSKRGIGYFLLQKNCAGTGTIPRCCDNGWGIVLAGSRFLQPTEERYAPIEGEALAVAWSLEQTKYFTQGCKDLVVVTDHKPLLKILSDKSLDEISNHRIFSLKQQTLPWQFQSVHTPKRSNEAADAISRQPAGEDPPAIKVFINTLLTGQYISDVVTVATIGHNFSGLSWDTIAEETRKEPASYSQYH